MSPAAHGIRFDWARRQWNALTLARQFLLAGGAVLLAGMFIIGLWVTRQIEDGVVRNSAAATALYVDGVIAPLFPDLEGKELSEGARRALDETLAKGELAKRIAFFKIWVENGLIAYSSEPGLIGKTFEPTEHLKEAWAGRVAAEFDSLDDAENRTERNAGVPLLEIYSPIREPWSGQVVAVAEFYEVATDLADNLAAARLRSWLVVALVTVGMMGLLSGIVIRGSVVISEQRRALERRVAELSDLLRQNEELRVRVQGASSRATMVNERYLRRISADLHDGPAQLLALALLRMKKSPDKPDRAPDPVEMSIRDYLEEAMREIRSICRGLTLPQIEAMSLNELLRSVVDAHERRTSTQVELRLPGAVTDLSQSEKICIYRFVQEGLSNAFRHAGGAGQSVQADMRFGRLFVTVSDRGSGFDTEVSAEGGIGLAGLRERVESLGGEFTVKSSASGTVLGMGLKPSLGEAR